MNIEISGEMALVLHQYLGTIRRRLAEQLDSEEVIVFHLPGFDLPVLLSRPDARQVLDEIGDTMRQLLEV